MVHLEFWMCCPGPALTLQGSQGPFVVLYELRKPLHPSTRPNNNKDQAKSHLKTTIKHALVVSRVACEPNLHSINLEKEECIKKPLTRLVATC